MFVVFVKGLCSTRSFYWISDDNKRMKTKEWKQRRGAGRYHTFLGGFVMRDGSIIPQKYHEPIWWASGGPDTVLTDPPLCSVLQMGGGAVQARAAGVQGGIPAAGLETKTMKHVLLTQTCTDFRYLAKQKPLHKKTVEVTYKKKPDLSRAGLKTVRRLCQSWRNTIIKPSEAATEHNIL